MIKYWLKNRFLFSLGIVLTISFVCGLLFYMPYIENCAENHYKIGIFEDTSIDYDIPSPSKDQLDEIATLDFVEECMGYYITEGDLRIGDKNVKTKLMLTDDDNLSLSAFPDQRVIEQNKVFTCPFLCIGYDFAKKHDLSLGDKVKYKDFEITVAKIAEPDAYKDAQLVCMGEGTDLQKYIQERTTSYSGAYIQVNDKTKAEKYLRSYKPLGRLRDRSDFDSEEKYMIHFNGWNDADYSNEITSFEEKLLDVRLSDTNQFWTGITVYVVVMLVSTIVLFIRKSERVYFRQRKSKRGITGYYLATFVIEMLIPTVVFLLGGCLVKTNSEYYITSQVFTRTLTIVCISVVCAAIADFILNLVLKKSVSK